MIYARSAARVSFEEDFCAISLFIDLDQNSKQSYESVECGNYQFGRQVAY